MAAVVALEEGGGGSEATRRTWRAAPVSGNKRGGRGDRSARLLDGVRVAPPASQSVGEPLVHSFIYLFLFIAEFQRCPVQNLSQKKIF